MPRVSTDRPHKHARVSAILDAHGADELLLTTPENLAWYFDGARVQVPFGGAAVCSALIHRDGSAVITALENEADRLAAEEIAGAEFRSIPWFASLTEAAPDTLVDTAVADELRAARAALLPQERQRYAALGADSAAAVTAVLRHARPDMTEHALAAELGRAVLAIGATPNVILVAGSSRGGVQHPLPTDAVLGDQFLAVVTAVRHGLHASFSRWVRFRGSETTDERALRLVEADIFAATRPDRALSEILSDIGSAYVRHGFGNEGSPAWRAHHQGGPTGYVGRDPKASPTSTQRVVSGGAFAWNPWVPGAKLEDTVIADHTGVTTLTTDPLWPTVNVNGLARPDTLDLS
ncbi:M24 family metallopeptidase [Microbacterium sp. A82]|uniref:M24 family metallopeptidase n=1 Tax=unclassified Microbacterium TaxID=2609290 RepID=UPI003F35E060